MMKKIALLLCSICLLISCNIKPKAIDFGNEACHFCKMTIVDRSHAAQLVSQKGKVFNFDASECMIHYLQDKDERDYSYILVTDFSQPGSMIDAHQAVFIISQNIPSPMGAFLSTVAEEKEARQLVETHGGDLYNWDEIKNMIDTH